jgi:hypothetical protein
MGYMMALSIEQQNAAVGVKRALNKAGKLGLSVRGYDGCIYLLNISDFYESEYYEQELMASAAESVGVNVLPSGMDFDSGAGN